MNANSFSVFGEKRDQYCGYMPALLRQHYTFYPDWKFILYSDGNFPEDHFVSRAVKSGHIDLRIVNRSGQLCDEPISGIAMLWRLKPIWEGIDNVFPRDLDSILTPRQLKYVTRFLNSQKYFHGINDNPAHNIPLMGGMIGINADKFREKTGFHSFNQMINESSFGSKWKEKGSDQDFMMMHLWPRLKGNFLLDSPSGPNERYHLKDCVPGISINHVSHEIMNGGDNFTNYIGAAAINGSIEDMVEFYDKYGNQNKMKEIPK